MKITEEWRMFDPDDFRTHPEGISRVEFEFENGRLIEGQYSRDADFFVGVGLTPDNPAVKRWRYTSAKPDKS